MKNVILSILFIVCCLDADAQFNAEVTGSYNVSYGGGRKQSIAKNNSGDIFCIVNPNGATAEYEILKFNGSNGNFISGVKIPHLTSGFIAELNPIAIIETNDNGVLVTGNYKGEVPANYPLTPGGQLQTVFYAKFDGNLDFQWLKLYYNAGIVDDDPETPNSYSDDIVINKAVTAVPVAGGGEHYYLLNEATHGGLDSKENPAFDYYFNIVRIDNTGDIMSDIIIPMHIDKARAFTITYLPNNDKLGITGISPIPVTKPFAFTIDTNWSSFSGIVEYNYNNAHNDVSNMVEGQNLTPEGDYNYFLSFITEGDIITHSNPCQSINNMIDVVNLLYLDNASLVAVDNWAYQAECQFHHIADISIRNTHDAGGDPALIMGFSNREYESSSSSTVVTNSAYLSVDESGSPLTMYKNNKTITEENQLRAFVPANNDDFFSLVYKLTPNNRIRVIRTDYKGYVNNNCSQQVSIIDAQRQIFGEFYDVFPEMPESEEYDYEPEFEDVNLQTALCQ